MLHSLSLFRVTTRVTCLTLYAPLIVSFKGYYTCRLPGALAGLGNTTVSVHILNTTMIGEHETIKVLS